MSAKLTPMMQQYFEVLDENRSPVFSRLFVGVPPEGNQDHDVR